MTTINELIYKLPTSLLPFEPQRLKYPINWVEHIPFVHYLIATTCPQTIVELGTHTGNSFCAMAQTVADLKLTCKLYAVDSWEGDIQAGIYGNEIYDDLKSYTDLHWPQLVTLIRKRFEQAVHDFPDGSIDLLHIDGLHTYEAVRNDFETWRPKLSEKAVIIFHDTAVKHGDFGVWRFWDELKSVYPSFNFLHGNGLGVLAYGSKLTADTQALFASAQRAEEAYRTFFGALGSHVTWLYYNREKFGPNGQPIQNLRLRDHIKSDLRMWMKRKFPKWIKS